LQLVAERCAQDKVLGLDKQEQQNRGVALEREPGELAQAVNDEV
jgi:hypothetical protein